jgi:hypothetical protein
VDSFEIFMQAVRQQPNKSLKALMARLFLNQLHDPARYPVGLIEVLAVSSQEFCERLLAFMVFCAAQRLGTADGIEHSPTHRVFGKAPERDAMHVTEAIRIVEECRR